MMFCTFPFFGIFHYGSAGWWLIEDLHLLISESYINISGYGYGYGYDYGYGYGYIC